jgi:hypothetical protein
MRRFLALLDIDGRHRGDIAAARTAYDTSR